MQFVRADLFTINIHLSCHISQETALQAVLTQEDSQDRKTDLNGTKYSILLKTDSTKK